MEQYNISKPIFNAGIPILLIVKRLVTYN